MSRTYALLKLLEHGPLSQSEIRQITRWVPQRAAETVRYLAETKRITRANGGRWKLA